MNENMFLSLESWYVLFNYLTLMIVLAQILGCTYFLFWVFRKIPSLPSAKSFENSTYPGVSIIRSCFNTTDNEENNFDLFYHQDYPGPIEIIYTVSRINDPIVPIIQKYLKKYPNFNHKLLIAQTKVAFWDKVDAMYDGFQAAQYDMLIFGDSDVVIGPEYVRQNVACLMEPGVSLVTIPLGDIRVNNAATGFKVAANNADLATIIMWCDVVFPRKPFAFGQSIAFRKSELTSFGPEAWDFINNFYADDLAFAQVFSQRNRKVVFRPIYCPVEYNNKSLRQVIEQKKRWAHCQRIASGSDYLYLAGMFVYPEIPALIAMLLSGFSSWATQLFFMTIMLRIIISALLEKLLLKQLDTIKKYFWTVPLWDLAQVYFFLNSFFNPTMTFSGKKYMIDKDYKLVLLPNLE